MMPDGGLTMMPEIGGLTMMPEIGGLCILPLQVHERSLDTDLLMLLVRRLLRSSENASLRVVLAGLGLGIGDGVGCGRGWG